MGQILNRLIRITKANSIDTKLKGDYDLDEDNDLKKIIDDLNKENKRNDKSDNKNFKSSSNQSNSVSIDGYYKLLGINKDASIDEIKSAYKSRIKEYHPDRLENFGEDIKELARKKTQEINEAYSSIGKQRGF